MTPILIDPAARLLAAHEAADPLISAARTTFGALTPMTVDSWRSSPVGVRVAGVLLLGLAWLAEDPRGALRSTMVETSHAVSAGHDWTWQAGQPTYAQLEERRRRATWSSPAMQAAAVESARLLARRRGAA